MNLKEEKRHLFSTEVHSSVLPGRLCSTVRRAAEDSHVMVTFNYIIELGVRRHVSKAKTEKLELILHRSVLSLPIITVILSSFVVFIFLQNLNLSLWHLLLYTFFYIFLCCVYFPIGLESFFVAFSVVCYFLYLIFVMFNFLHDLKCFFVAFAVAYIFCVFSLCRLSSCSNLNLPL